MSAKVITLANQKGGSGKTTVTMQLAGGIAHRGKYVLIIDADPQGTATRWAESADLDTPFPATVISVSTYGGSVQDDVDKHREIFDYILIDCPPAVDSEVPRSALLSADLVIVPIIPSPTDLWSAVGIRELIRDTKITNVRLRSRLVANMCQPNTLVAKEILEILDEFGIQQFYTQIKLRTAYRQTALFGTSVSTNGQQYTPAAQEIDNLTNEVLAILQ